MIFQDKEEMSYLAGIVDGEGCFYLAQHKQRGNRLAYNTPRIVVSNTNKDLMNWLKDNFGGYIFQQKKRKEHWKTGYQWVVEGNKALMLANWLEPLLIVKRDEVKKLYG
jgi:hypothetical protein